MLAKTKALLLAGAVVAATSSLPVNAYAQSELDELRDELRRLRAEVEELKQQQRKLERRPETPEAPAAAPPAPSVPSVSSVVEAARPPLPESLSVLHIPGSPTSVTISGFVKLDIIHDFGATAPDDDYTNLPEQPLAGSGATTGRTKFTAQSSRFSVDTNTPTPDGPFNSKLETDFYAYGDPTVRNRLRLRRAYGEYGGLLIGVNASTFVDVDALPETLDVNGPIGSPSARKAMVRYATQNLAGPRLSLALEDPTTGARVPDLIARVDQSLAAGSFNIKLLSHEKRNANDNAGYFKRGYGAGFGLNYKPAAAHLLSVQYAYVEGDYDNQAGSNGYIDTGTKFLFDHNHGVVAGWTYMPSEQWRGTLSAGINRSTASSEFQLAYGPNVANRSLAQMHLNLIYTPWKNLDLGVEMIYGKRTTFDDQTGTLSRINFAGRSAF